MRAIDNNGNIVELKPTPLTDKELADMKIQHEQERLDWLNLLDNKIVEAKLYYYKGVRPATTMTQESYVTTHNHKPIYTPDLELDGYGEAIVIGTERQRCEDQTFDRVTGIYSLHLTEKMLRAYEENNNQIIITKQY